MKRFRNITLAAIAALIMPLALTSCKQKVETEPATVVVDEPVKVEDPTTAEDPVKVEEPKKAEHPEHPK